MPVVILLMSNTKRPGPVVILSMFNPERSGLVVILSMSIPEKPALADGDSVKTTNVITQMKKSMLL